MSALAKILLESGYEVSGSDISKNHLTDYLQSLGAEIFIGHNEENVEYCDVVVKSSAIKDTNPELKMALSKNKPVLHRAQLLNELMIDKNISIGITGTHGKTTTTGMITTIFHGLGLQPSFAIGGELPHLKTNAAYGKGEYFIAELDESDGTIQYYHPDISVITNLEFEHPDHYKGGFDQMIQTFVMYLKNLDPLSKIIINVDDEGNNKLIESFLSSGQQHQGEYENSYNIKRFITYSISSNDADYHAYIVETNSITIVDIFKKKTYIGQIKLNVPGHHNISNAMAAIAVALESGLDFFWIASVLSMFAGMKKRFQTLGDANGARIVDDYAHHPTEIKATLKAARSLKPGRIIAAFQPHRYTRFASLWNDFLRCLDEADIVYVCDVYSAEEDPIKNINSEEFHKQLQHRAAHYVKGPLENVAEEIIKEMRENDIVLTMGAGTITKLGRIILDMVKE